MYVTWGFAQQPKVFGTLEEALSAPADWKVEASAPAPTVVNTRAGTLDIPASALIPVCPSQVDLAEATFDALDCDEAGVHYVSKATPRQLIAFGTALGRLGYETPNATDTICDLPRCVIYIVTDAEGPHAYTTLEEVPDAWREQAAANRPSASNLALAKKGELCIPPTIIAPGVSLTYDGPG